MKTLKDTATLVALLLLALTVRVGSRDLSPMVLATPAHAATEQTPVWELEPEALPVTTEVEREAETVRHLVWEIGGTRVVIVLGDDEPIAPPSPSEVSPVADPNPCDAHRARVSC